MKCRNRYWAGSAASRLIAILLLVGGGVIAARPAWHFARRAALRYQMRRLWSEAQKTSCADGGAPAAWLSIPAAGIDTLVTRGITASNLHRFPCMSESLSALTIMGHRDTHFRKLGVLQPGDCLSLQMPRAAPSIYQVVETEILSPQQTERRLLETNAGMLALVSCYPFRYVGPAPKRFLAWTRPRR